MSSLSCAHLYNALTHPAQRKKLNNSMVQNTSCKNQHIFSHV